MRIKSLVFGGIPLKTICFKFRLLGHRPVAAILERVLTFLTEIKALLQRGDLDRNLSGRLDAIFRQKSNNHGCRGDRSLKSQITGRCALA
jgi:hypothetical protein